MTLPDIWNGPHHGSAIGHLPRPDGSEVAVWSSSPADILQAVLLAAGPIPQQPILGLGGHVEAFYGSAGKDGFAPPALIYNPAEDEINKDTTTAFQAQVTAWNARVQMLTAIAQSWITQGQKSSEHQ